jgi:hypothetical protein
VDSILKAACRSPIIPAAPAIRQLYELIVHSPDDAPVIQAAATLLPQPVTRWEKIWASPGFQVLVYALIGLIVLSRLAAMF